MQRDFDRQALKVVEAAYRVADDVEGWVAGVLEATRPLLDRGGGLQGYAYRILRSGSVALPARVVQTSNTPTGFAEASLETAARVPVHVVPGLFCTAPAISTLYERDDDLVLRDSRQHRPFEVMGGYGMQDMIGVVAYDPSGVGVLICAPSERVLPRFDKRRIERWTMLRAHLVAGLRLQHALGWGAHLDAILEPGGRVVHAEGKARGTDARDALRRRALEIDRARSAAGRRDAGRALHVWNGLVEGTWSLVDSFDSDGRRYLIARRNDPKLTTPRPLSVRERQILAFASLGYTNKQIAYTLGLAASTVSSHLRAGMRRLQIANAGALASIPLQPPRERS